MAAGGFVALIAAMGAIWGLGFRSGVYSLAFAAMATLLVAGIAIAGIIRLACARMTMPPPDCQSR
jgi:hypothetical protein